MSRESRPITLERLRADGEQFLIELSREFYETHAGLKPRAVPRGRLRTLLLAAHGGAVTCGWQ